MKNIFLLSVLCFVFLSSCQNKENLIIQYETSKKSESIQRKGYESILLDTQSILIIRQDLRSRNDTLSLVGKMTLKDTSHNQSVFLKINGKLLELKDGEIEMINRQENKKVHLRSGTLVLWQDSLPIHAKKNQEILFLEDGIVLY